MILLCLLKFKNRTESLRILCQMMVQEHLPYADDSNAVTPMSEENGAMVVPLYSGGFGMSRHSSYTSHASRLSYTSHADLLAGGRTKESRLRSRSSRNSSATVNHQPNACQAPTLMDNKHFSRDFVCYQFFTYNKIFNFKCLEQKVFFFLKLM